MKSELVDRAKVMESLTKEYNIRWDERGLKLAWIEKAVNEVPAAKPSSYINRERLIEQLKLLEKFNDSDVPEWVLKVIGGM